MVKLFQQTLFITAISFFSGSFLAGQAVEPMATMEITGNGKAIFFHDLTGVPIVRSTTTFTGVNPKTHEKIWEVERSGMSAIEETSGDAPTDYIDLYNTFFAFINGNIINVVTGDILVNKETEEIQRFNSFYLLPEKDLVLIELGAKGMIKLYAINALTAKFEWSVDLREMSGLGQMVASSGSSGGNIPPAITAAGDLLYHNGKNLALINLTSGELNWNNKLNPGYIYTNDDATRLVVAEARGGLGGAMDMSGGTKFGKSIHLLDAATGESLWTKGSEKMGGNVQFIMPYDGGFLVVHDEGTNIFDYTPGKSAEGRWKKDFSEKGIVNIVEEEDGLMIYFKNKRMLVDPASGEELWKRAERLEQEPRAFTMGSTQNQQTVGNATIYTRGNNVYTRVNGGERMTAFDAYTIDEANQRLVAVYDPSPESVSIGPRSFRLTAIDLNTGKSHRSSVTLRRGEPNVDVTDEGYFIYNDRGFTLMAFNDGEWSETASNFYPDPAGADRAMKRLALIAGNIGANTRSTGSYLVSNNPNASAAYNDRINASNEMADAGWDMTERKINGRVQADYAYFFARNDDGQLTLFKVEKNSGEEVREFPFDDNTPVYEIDEANNQLYYIVDSTLSIFPLG